MSEPVVSAAPAAPAASAPAQPTSAFTDQPNSAPKLEAAKEESDEEVEEIEAEPVKKEEKAKAVEKRIKKLKLKVDNKEFDEEIDLDDDEALIRHLQLGKMGQKRAQEKADLEKRVQHLMSELEKDPLEVMKQMGKNPEDIIEAYINRQLEEAKKSPEQLEREKLETELQTLKREREQEKETQKSKELERLQQQAFQQYDVQMEQALTKSNLPKTAYTVKKMADYMLVALEAGYDVTPDDVTSIVEEELNNDLKEMFASLPEERIEELLGEQVLNKLRKRRVAKAQDAQKMLPKAQVKDTGNTAKEEKPKEKVSFKNFFGV
jgi:hypothetical protein